MDTQQNTAPYFLHQEIDTRAYEYFGVHRADSGGYTFRVWAPGASSVCVVGDFCGWSNGVPMYRIADSGVWELTLWNINIRVGDKYKYKIFGQSGEKYRADPYAYAFEKQPADASVVYELSGYRWRDDGWMRFRRENYGGEYANIYQLDLGTWRRRDNGEYLTYAELSKELAPYVKQMGYTHIALTDVCEYIYSGDKFEPYAYYAPSSRFGSPKDFMAFVDSMHEAGVGVVLDLSGDVFPHTAVSDFDGGRTYERADGKAFDLSKSQVESFLASAPVFWVEKYHVDGFITDGLSSFGGVNADYLRTVSLFRRLNALLKKQYPDVLLISATPDNGTVATSERGGMGFDAARGDAWQSRNDVCEQKGSLIQKANGDYLQKFAQVRAAIGELAAFAGHKLLFMGTEFGQFRGWSRDFATEWFLLDYQSHARLQLYTAELNALFLASPALNRGEQTFIDSGCEDVTCVWRGCDGQELIVAVNNGDNEILGFKLNVPCTGLYRQIFSSDSERYGGEDRYTDTQVRARTSIKKEQNSISINLPPHTIVIFIRVGTTPKKRKSK